ncbi:cation-transporting P-type ATPase [Microbispora sp. SCL1-1]|uniref:cation-translocating P-type ATPase n=1 Tax=unclassified Microbispora TaxID=2614687 RepID=UPI00115B43C7|nr:MULTISPECIES: cation-transporting P-type ATPase [unclassified Microbispora]NJP29049.1 cation-transporting P-type ATPase [Microbispora sp. CL1-1]TQS06518.1 cation-transporting P-type ATPase [Microbispora sp. SCL1-1]
MEPAVRTLSGLTEEEAARRLAEHGPNEIPQPKPPNLLVRAARQLADPMSVLLLVAGLVTLLVLGEVPEGAAILAILLVNVVIGVAQETKADKAVRALHTLTAPMATVVRGDVARRIPAAEVVPGDIVTVAAGDRVPADARLVETSALAVDEALLTGESLSADKRAGGAAGPHVPLGDRTGEIFSGTLVVRGSGTAEVLRTGSGTEVGRIATALGGGGKGPLEIELGQVSRRIGLLAVAAGTLMVLIGLTRVSRGEATLIDIILAGVALAIAAVPESMAAAVTTALAMAAQRMARLGVIVRRLPAMEALGATTVIATDKTGTLTTGHLTVADHIAVPGADLWRAALRCNDARDGVGDAVDVALAEAAARHGVRLPPAETRLDARPFDAETRSMAVVTALDGGPPLLTVKGAPEVVLARCAPGGQTDRLAEAVPELARRGLRVLALAEGRTGDLDATGLRPVGLVALQDEIRASARQAVADCRGAGIRVVMVTGDHAETARAVAREVGIDPEPLVTGAAIEGDGGRARLPEAAVVARVDPEVKLDLVRALKERGDVVAMTGDGVNDAPALRHADVGVAMAGEEGTDVAREAAAVVVTNGELGTIVTGVREGRRLRHNVASMIGYLLAGNLAEILIVLTGLLVWPDLVVPLLPVHLLWINLVLDGIPAIALGVDRPAGDPLALRPRGDGLLSWRVLRRILVRSVVVAVLVFAIVETARRLGWSDEQVRTQAVLALVFARLTLAYVVRARRRTFERGWWHGRAVAAAVSATLLLQVLVTAVPVLGAPLALVPLPPLGWAMAVAAAVLTVLLCDALRTDGMRRGEARDRGRRRRVTAEPGGSGDGQHEPGRI